MSLVSAVEVPRRPVSGLEPIIGGPRYVQLVRAADQVRQLLAGRTIWNVNSTAVGGGVAEMLQALRRVRQRSRHPDPLAGDHRRRRVLRDHQAAAQPDPRQPAGGPAQPSGAPIITRGCSPLTRWSCSARIRPGDIVLLHDPQTAGLAAPLARAGARVVWRCHIGVGLGERRDPGGVGLPAAAPGAPQRDSCSRAASTCRRGSRGEKVAIIPPSIDPFSPKNQQLDADTVRAILARLGVLDGAAPNGARVRSCAATATWTPSPARRSSPAKAAPARMIRW